MREAKLISTGLVPVSEIDDSVRLRPVSQAAVEALIASIETTGIMKDEVIVRRVAHQNNRLVLIAGGHRMAAARALGWETVPAKVYDCDDNWADLVEVDDNLAHSDLSALELAVFMSKRKEAYLRAHPEAAQGIAGANARWNDATEMISFASMVAEKRGMSERHVRNFARIGERLKPETVSALHGRDMTFNDLDQLARAETSEQGDVVEAFLGGAKNIKAAVAQVRGQTPPPIDKVDKAHRELRDRFSRAPKAAQRRFLEELWTTSGTALLLEEAKRKVEANN